MCLYANAFVRATTELEVKLPDSPAGLFASVDHGVHAQFRSEFAEEDGVFLTFHDGHCLCQYSNWNTLLRYAEEIRQANGLDVLPIMVYWTSSEYESLTKVEVDPKLDAFDEKPDEGTIFMIGISVIRRLRNSISLEITAHFKSGKIVRGTLEEYHEAGDYGLIRTEKEEIHFTSKEIADIELNSP